LLGPICSCSITAGSGASAETVIMLGEGLKEVNNAINIMMGMLFGMICDGAKKSCALKASVAGGSAVEVALLALNGVKVSDKDGFISREADTTIRYAGEICKAGFANVDKSVIDVMVRSISGERCECCS